ncbi:MAG: glucose/sorbosone dehydrogenase-like protein [Actinomycetota bacterium]|nr:MAG: glucose/sorbosone dehydrogenase-like protein [Actinomycetota bacterium]
MTAASSRIVLAVTGATILLTGLSPAPTASATAAAMTAAAAPTTGTTATTVTAATTARAATTDAVPGAEPVAAAAARALAAPAVLPVADLRLTFTPVRGGLRQPTDVVATADGTGRLLVAERRGTVRLIRHGKLRSRPYLDLRRVVNAAGNEQGLLGLAVDPQFSRKPRLWVTYTRGDGALVLARVRATSYRALPRRSSLTVVLVVKHPAYDNHNGGDLAFGPDGYLYLGTGDGGGAGDPRNNAQNPRSLSGKLLRLDVTHSCHRKAYCIPPSNPFLGRPGMKKQIWLTGLRNPWRFSFDATTGDLWIADVGQNRWEEVDRVRPSQGGADLGWSCREGDAAYDAGHCRPGVASLAPVATLCHPGAVAGCTRSTGGQSLTGGYVYWGAAYAAVAAGTYVSVDWATGTALLVRDGTSATSASTPGVTAFGQTETGELVAVTYDGRLMSVGFTTG